MKLLFDYSAKLKVLRPFLPYLFGLGLIALFGYTSWTINTAFSPQPDVNSSLIKGKVTFDQATINAVKALGDNSSQVQGVSTESTSPFGR